MEALCVTRASSVAAAQLLVQTHHHHHHHHHHSRSLLSLQCFQSSQHQWGWRCMKKDMTRAPLAFSSPSSSQQVYTRWADCGTCSRRRLSTKIKCQAIPEEAVTIDNSTVLVVGGGGLGMEVVRSFAKAGSWVTAYQRGEKFRKEIEELGAMLAIGDVLDVGAIEKTLRGNSFDAIVCTVGGGTANPEVDREGPINLINAAKNAGVKRFLMVSSVGAGDSVKAVDERTLSILKPVLDAKGVAEDAVRDSGIAYTILRPGGLMPPPGTGNGILTEDSSIGGIISRSDVAALIMKVLFNKQTEGKTFTAIDKDKLLPPTQTLEGVELFSLN
ncbi:hypothetical protein BDL97_02G153100 [Sphagnum fallax]|nr:hypothetical protein BDL97_02G153100 [Sphagnum fallax]